MKKNGSQCKVPVKIERNTYVYVYVCRLAIVCVCVLTSNPPLFSSALSDWLLIIDDGEVGM